MYGDRVRDTSATIGTNAIALDGAAPTGFMTFLARFGATPTPVAYCMEGVYPDGNQTGQWEVGTGTFDGSNQISRSAANVLGGSSGVGVLVPFATGTKNVFCTAPAAYLLPPGANTQVAYNNAGIPGANANFTYDSATNTLTVGKIAGSGPAVGLFAPTLTIQPRVPTVTEIGGALTLSTPSAVRSNTAAGQVNLIGGDGLGTGAGGNSLLRGGNGGVNGFGGGVSLFGGAGNGVGNGGDFAAIAGNAVGSGNGGPCSFTAGSAAGSGNGGNIRFRAGTSDFGNGGSIQFETSISGGPSVPKILMSMGGGSDGINDVPGEFEVYSNLSLSTIFKCSVDIASYTGTIGFFGVTPVVRAAAYTQTFPTASRTVSNPTFTNLATTAATNVTPWGFSTQAQADALATKVNQLAADVVILRQLINSLIDDAQAYGLAQ